MAGRRCHFVYLPVVTQLEVVSPCLQTTNSIC
ncbi:hypothetical protein CBM2592_B100125 [Cupriavidus taiwanensis]|nr:hypothetical protein CBM2592_B100125 [Cupriavidus taiwanensis]SOY73926.1 hypothetical protein CBM2588_B90129 [Cupriavidus taiwanensis]SOY97911.1 hypothetical protein CBM2591_B80126 [Cupriavidus taiwanensis]SOZ31424.1 hypothetical protein CBM2608_B80001 [Cupriavidus taiwanensis]SOZ67740.1 hypothetical protein CBM2617_B110127 [Cupriavidus taiwanensis]